MLVHHHVARATSGPRLLRDKALANHLPSNSADFVKPTSKLALLFDFLPLYHVHSSLKPILKMSLSAPTRKYLGLDSTRVPTLRSNGGMRGLPSDFAASTASSGVCASLNRGTVTPAFRIKSRLYPS